MTTDFLMIALLDNTLSWLLVGWCFVGFHPWMWWWIPVGIFFWIPASPKKCLNSLFFVGDLRILRMSYPWLEGSSCWASGDVSSASRLMTSLMPHMFSDVGATIQDTAAMSKAELDFRMEALGLWRIPNPNLGPPWATIISPRWQRIRCNHGSAQVRAAWHASFLTTFHIVSRSSNLFDLGPPWWAKCSDVFGCFWYTKKGFARQETKRWLVRGFRRLD